MRKKFSVILILTVFLSLQFGKIATYLYCKWQTEIVQNKPDCGCDDHLVAMFSHHEDSSKNVLAKVNLTEDINEFMPRQQIEIPELLLSIHNCFTSYNSPLNEGIPGEPFHPPIV